MSFNPDLIFFFYKFKVKTASFFNYLALNLDNKFSLNEDSTDKINKTMIFVNLLCKLQSLLLRLSLMTGNQSLTRSHIDQRLLQALSCKAVSGIRAYAYSSKEMDVMFLSAL